MNLHKAAERLRELQDKWDEEGARCSYLAKRDPGDEWQTVVGISQVAWLLSEARDAGAFDCPAAGTLGDFVEDVPIFLVKLGRMTGVQLVGDDPAAHPVARIGDALDTLAKVNPTSNASPLPTSEAEQEVLQQLKNLAPGKGMTGRELANEIGRGEDVIRHTILKLRDQGHKIPNRRNVGYWLTQ